MACFLIAVPSAWGQYDTATVVGTITDANGATVPAAEVTLRNVDLGTILTRKTDSHGSYEFPDVQIGNYTVTAEAPGFDQTVTAPFALTVATRQEVNVPLKVGGAQETLNVQLANLGLQTQTGDQNMIIENQEIEDLPLNGRDYTDLALLAPGVQAGSLEDGTVQQRRGSFVVNGNRSSVNNFLLDGLDNNSYQVANQGYNNQAVAEATDATAEYKIITSNFPAEYGRAGGAVVIITTKSGSNKLHGSAYEFIRNTVLDAWGPFYGSGVKPALVQNQFGGSLGGPVPHGNNFFFFIDYEGFRQAAHAINTSTVPTAQMDAGIFMAPLSSTNATPTPVPLKNPLTGTPYYTGVIPTSAFSPFAAAVLAALPQANQSTFPTDFSYNPPGHNFRDQADLRLDKYFGNRVQTFIRLSKQSNHILTAPDVPGPAGGEGFGHTRVLTSSGAGGVTITVTPNSVLDLRYGVTFTTSGKVPFNTGVPFFQTALGIPYPISPGLPTAGLNTQVILEFSQLGVEPAENQFSNPQTYDFKANYTWARGKHSYSFGYEHMLLNEDVQNNSPMYGQSTYEGEFSKTGCPSSPVIPGCAVPASSKQRDAAYGLADFLFGAQSEYSLANNTSPTEYFTYNYAYAEDSWRVFPTLTVNYGLRYELSMPERSRNNTIVNFDPNTNSLILSSGGSVYNQALVNPKLDDFAPRFGFSWQAYPNIVFRGGYGLSYVQWNRFGSVGDLLSNGPYSITTNVYECPTTVNCSSTAANYPLSPFCPNNSQSLTCYRTTMQGFPASMIAPQAFNTAASEAIYIPKNSPVGYVQSYSLGTQIQLDKGTIFSLAYVGNHAVRLRVVTDYNQKPTAPAGTGYTVGSRPISNFTDIADNIASGFLRYNSLQAQITHRFVAGLFFINSFTWSKGIDNASAPLEASHGDNYFVNFYNIPGDTGISGYNQKINDSFSAVWKIPYGAHLDRAWKRQTAGGWALTTITRLTTGVPINITYTPAVVTTGLGYSYRPNYTGLLSTLINPKSQWQKSATAYSNVFAPSTRFPAPTTSPYGNFPRNGLTGPNYTDVDLGVQKNFTTPHKSTLQFRIEAFNVMNHTNFKAPDVDSSSSSFGEYVAGASSVYPSREIQLGARLTF